MSGGGRGTTITHPDRVLFPDPGYTKGDLAAYHREVADHLLRHLHDRPLMLQRFPEGIAEPGFYQKDAAHGVPDVVRTVEVPKEGGVVHHPVVDGPAALVALTNLSTVSFHRWHARADRLRHPDLLVVDLDPGDGSFDTVRWAAWRTRDLLDELGLCAYLQVTGSRGVHVVTPLDRGATTDAVAAFARAIAAVLARRHPDRLTDEFRMRARRGRLYLDVGRNGWAQTAIAPYSVRPRPSAPVATPITWEELDDPRLRADGFTLATVPDRLRRTGDPWRDIARHGRGLAGRVARLQEMLDRSG